MTDKIRADDRELLEAFDELYKAQIRAMRALVNRITVISGADQIDVARLREEVARLRSLVEATTTDDFDEGHP